MECVQIWSFFWSVFSRIQTEYGEIRSISPYSVRMRANTEQKKLRIWTLFTQCKSKLKYVSFLNTPWKTPVTESMIITFAELRILGK